MRSRMREIDITRIVVLLVKIAALLLILGNAIKVYLWNVKINTYKISILGDNPMIVYQGDEYVEPGYMAFDYQNNEKTEKVVVDNNVNSNVIGDYRVKYSINSFFKKNVVTREVTVKENPLDYVKFVLKGEKILNIKRKDRYNELGYSVASDRGNFTKNVTITNNVNTSKVGTYEVIYTLKIGNKQRNLKRIVHVTGEKYGTNVDISTLTNKNVTIKVENYLKDFDYFINPNGVKVTDEKFDFVVEKNGTYEFKLYDKNKIETKFQVVIKNIDKTPPVGVCNAYVSKNKTSYKIEATDEHGVTKYVHNEKEYTVNNFVIDKIEDTGTVNVYDKLGNAANIKCVVEYEYIGPTNNNYKYKYESATLKYWIENAGDYYKTTHIWVKDAYNQMKVAIPPKIGSLLTAKSIIKNEIKNKNYSNKGMVAVNASGIVGGGFGTRFTKLSPSWVGTAEIPLIINDGKIIRDSTGIEFPYIGVLTYGMKKDGYLGFYRFEDGKKKEDNLKKKEQIINDGVRYTFGFEPVLVWDGVVQTSRKDNNIRQGICQIDRNNFIIVTNTNNTNNRTKGFNLKALAEYMVKQKCKIGLNLDGGGSTNFYYKGNSGDLYSVTSSGRGLVDILYFVEK